MVNLAQQVLELHLVTAAQRGYSLRLFERQYRQFTGRSFVKCTARPTYAFLNTVPKAVSEGS